MPGAAARSPSEGLVTERAPECGLESCDGSSARPRASIDWGRGGFARRGLALLAKLGATQAAAPWAVAPRGRPPDIDGPPTGSSNRRSTMAEPLQKIIANRYG